MKKTLFRFVSLLLSVLIAVLAFAPATLAASTTYGQELVAFDGEDCDERMISKEEYPTRGNTWLTGRFNGNYWSSSHLFTVNNINKTPKFKVYTYNANGQNTSGGFHIRVTTPQDSTYVKYYWYKSNGCTITLDKGYTKYYVSIQRSSSGSSNVAKCYAWAFKATSAGDWSW